MSIALRIRTDGSADGDHGDLPGGQTSMETVRLVVGIAEGTLMWARDVGCNRPDAFLFDVRSQYMLCGAGLLVKHG